MTGKLYVIGTPIGNLKDITLRAIETLEQVEILFCEDSRVTARLINQLREDKRLTNRPRYVPYNEFNEERVAQLVLAEVAAGKQVGLVSDAGMPGLSDPGYRAMHAVLEAQLPMEVIPGVTALTTALPYSGIGGEVTLYLGFLPKKTGKAQKLLAATKQMMQETGTGRVVLYVSPHRLGKDLALLSEVMGAEAKGVICRELTKLHEERIEGSLGELLNQYTNKPIKGEIVLVVALEK